MSEELDSVLLGGSRSAAQQSSLTTFDFRRSSKFGREHVRSLEGLHESFARRFASNLTQALRTVVQIKPLAVDELSYESYIRSLPNPSVMALVTLDPLPGSVVMDVSTQMGLLCVDRLLGGLGLPAGLRRPTDLETQLLTEILGHSVGAFEDTFAPLIEVSPQVASVESNPSFVQAVPPTEMTLLLTFNFSLAAASNAEALLTLCYPLSTLQPVLDRLHKHAAMEAPATAEKSGEAELWANHVENVDVDVSVRLRDSKVSSRDVAALQVGDVLRLDHRVQDPLLGVVQGREVLEGFVGRTGKRLGFRISDWRLNNDD